MGSIAEDQHPKAASAHVLVISHGASGHFTPSLRLATQLARRGIAITFVSSEGPISRRALTKIDGDGSSSSELLGLDFRFVPLGLPEGLYAPLGIMSRSFREAFKPEMEKMVHEKKTGITGGPTSIISDMFFVWAQDFADEMQIPRYIFVPSGAIYPRWMQGFLPYYESCQFQISETDGNKKLMPFDWPVCIPGLPPLLYHEIPPSAREDYDDYRRRCEEMWRSAGVLVNSFFQLEEKVIESWRNIAQAGSLQSKAPKIYSVGPLASSTSFPNGSPPGLEDSASKCLPWLGLQPSSSVLYIAFGSHFRLLPEEIHELALGLEDSKQHFLWVIPQLKGSSEGFELRAPAREEALNPSSITEALPPGFEARIGDRGCIVTGWAPQVQILAHRAIGGFLTHSGWNSTLESIAQGVPMISWPQGAEQHINCRYLVDDLKIAVQLQTGPRKILKRSEVERTVRLLLVEPERKAIRSRVEELQRKAAAAVADNGSRSRIFAELLDDIRKHALSPHSGRER